MIERIEACALPRLGAIHALSASAGKAAPDNVCYHIR